MRIVYLSASAHVGGAEAVLLDLLATLRSAEPTWTLGLVAPAEGPLLQSASALGVSTSVLPFPGPLATLGDSAAGGPSGHRVTRTDLAWRVLKATPAIARYEHRL